MSDTKFEWETNAIKGLPMPDGLTLSEQKAYMAIVSISDLYHKHTISQDEATASKEKILKQCKIELDTEKQRDQLTSYNTKVINATWQAIAVYLKDRTLENADRVINIFEGFERPWIT